MSEDSQETPQPPPQPPSAAAPAEASAVVCRSVADFDSEDALRSALMSLDLSCSNERDEAPLQDDCREEKDVKINDNWDWVIANLDESNSVPQTVGNELRRLRALKSYLILDSEREATFDTLTNMASRTFEVPIALVSLVDLGRQWFMSNHGLGDTRQTPRKLAFCAHAILGKSDILEVTDTHKDPRFHDHGLVVGPPYIRFYAGAPLTTPEGYKLGTFCIIDTKPWPKGMTETQRANLIDFASIASKTMEDRRQLVSEADPSRLVGAAAHDLMAPLLGVQSALSVLEEDASTAQKLDPNLKECIKVANQGTHLMRRICQFTIETLNNNNKSSMGCAQIPWLFQKSESSPCVNLNQFVQTLNLLMEAVPKKVPLTISLDSDAPEAIVCDDLKLIRCSLNFLSNACRKAKSGSIRFEISPKENNMLLFTCTDTGKDLDYGVDGSPFGTCSNPGRPKSGLSGIGYFSVASQIDSLGGKFGFRKRGEGKDGEVLLDHQGHRMTGSVFWFSVPILLPKAPPQSLCQVMETSTTNERRIDNGVATSLQATTTENSISPTSVITSQSASANSKTVAGGWKLGAKSDKTAASGEARPAAAKAKEQAPMEKMKKALVIEDSVIVAKTLARGLTRLGYEVTEARNGKEGLEALKKELFDLTLCDFIMPKMDGIDMCEKYRDWEKTQGAAWRQYIIGISAHAGENDIQKGLSVGMNGFQVKPITTKVLKELIESPKLVKFFQDLENARNMDSADGAECDMDESSSGAQNKGMKRSGESIEDVDASNDTMEDNEGVKQMLHPRPKRPKLVENDISRPASRTSRASCKGCLIATTDNSVERTKTLRKHVESMGWKSRIVHDGGSALELMKDRSWEAVFLDEDLPGLSASQCTSELRKWEDEQERGRRQIVFFVCSNNSSDSDDDRLSLVQPPAGFNGVLSNSLLRTDLSAVVKKTQLPSLLQGKGTSITTAVYS